jgi:cysteine desulfurase
VFQRGIRNVFPYFYKVKKFIYLDHNATTPVDPRVLEFMLPFFSEKFGNASSHTHTFGWTAAETVKDARSSVASLINCDEQELVFTSGATEALNLAIKGVWENYQNKGRHIITVQTEHKAVLDTCKTLEKRGAEITYLPVDDKGLIDLQQLRQAIRADTILIAVMFANNETGVLQPVEEIAAIAHQSGAFFLCDATQAIGKVNVDVKKLDIDLLAFSAHKLYGPKGVGALFVRRKSPRVTLHPQMDGGGHERGLRSGTLNVPGIAGFGRACEIAAVEMAADHIRIAALRDELEQAMLSVGNVIVNGSTIQRLFNTTNLSFKGIRADQLIRHLPYHALAMGSACTSALPEPSYVLKAMGVKDEDAFASIRFSLGKRTTAEEIRITIAAVKEAINLLRVKI